MRFLKILLILLSLVSMIFINYKYFTHTKQQILKKEYLNCFNFLKVSSEKIKLQYFLSKKKYTQKELLI